MRIACCCAVGLLISGATAAAQDPVLRGGPRLSADRGPRLTSASSDVSLRRVPHRSSHRDAAPAGVQRADWNETVYDRRPSDASSASAVIQVAGEAESTEAEPAPGATGETTTATPELFPGSNTEERLSRLDWPNQTPQVDPAETLKDWAENAGLLLGFAMVSLWLVRQWLGKRTFEGGPTTHLRTVESLTLPQRCRVHLVDVQGRQVLVATDQAGVKSVTVLPDRFEELVERSEQELDSPAAAPGGDAPKKGALVENWNTLRDSRLT